MKPFTMKQNLEKAQREVDLDSNMKYIGTCFDKDFVWHIMEII